MIMLTRKFTGEKAFEDVVVTGTVLGKDGKPMSKSRNNGVDPIEMFDKFGVDATRIYLASIATGADIKWNDLLIETYRNFANKIWNATRFCLLNAESAQVSAVSVTAPGDFPLPDRWIISRLNGTAIEVNKALSRYEFHTAVSLLYHFFWDDFCDWFIELKKDEINAGDIASTTRIVTVIESALRLLHPFMPYLTEELWQKLPGTSAQLHSPAYTSAERSLMLADFPLGDPSLTDEVVEREMGSVIDVIKKARNIRAEMNIPSSIWFDIHLAVEPEFQTVFRANEAQILKLARAGKLVIAETLDVPKASAKAVTSQASMAIPLEGLIDFDKERQRLDGQITKLAEEKSKLDLQLSNSNFVQSAPAEKVEGLRSRSIELDSQIFTLKTNLDALG
jgi:valyl-tRNA synthetase